MTKRDDTFDTSEEADAAAMVRVLNGNEQGELRRVIDQIEDLEAERAAIAEQIKEIKAEAKGNGFVVKIINKVIAIRKKDKTKREEEDAILDQYLNATGDL